MGNQRGKSDPRGWSRIVRIGSLLSDSLQGRHSSVNSPASSLSILDSHIDTPMSSANFF
ncbi:hypothetical protein BDV34DRAFT_186873 [Aspergillus parasiticus]|uniref:Uncharacterized protein n=1 Tax=Aspergillus parasiticus TaxID=5067 RepID=A0A5N6DZ45_ASPPA|nr:hypothetical protein BDV34DRAFT_186873 [Aspergillus parasiticus]